jgi:hypothetical protein
MVWILFLLFFGDGQVCGRLDVGSTHVFAAFEAWTMKGRSTSPLLLADSGSCSILAH